MNKPREIKFNLLSSAISVYNNSWHGSTGGGPRLERYVERFPNREIAKETLASILGHPNMDIDFDAFLRQNKDTDPGLDYNFYIKCLKEWVKSEGLEGHILVDTNPPPRVISEVSPTAISLWEEHYQYQTKCFITIQNLTITDCMGIFSADMLHLQFNREKHEKKLPFGGMTGLHILFKNNIFQGGNYQYISLLLGQKSLIELKGNVFNNTDLYFSSTGFNQERFLIMESNDFKNKHVFIGISPSSGGMRWMDSSGWLVDSTKAEVKARLEKRINEQRKNDGEKIRIDANELVPPSIQSIIKIKDNRFNILTVSGRSKLFLKGKNTINLFKSSVFSIHLDAPQNIDPQGKNSPHHQELFSELARQAAENRDTVQENIFKKQIQKFSYQQIRWQYRNWLRAVNLYNIFRQSVVLIAAIVTILIAIFA